MKFNLRNAVAEILAQNPDQKFTARELAQQVMTDNPKWCALKQERSNAVVTPINSEATLLSQISAEISAHRNSIIKKKWPYIKTTDGRPRKYYYTKRSDAAEVDDIEGKPSKIRDLPLEHTLYPILIKYLNTEHNLHAKRIDERRSNNNRGPKGNEWLYPDLVALEDLSSEWSAKVTECAKQYGDKKAKLWSFEVKRLINSSNVRSTFFQAVSNSSWANFGYLVAVELEEKAKKELRMLTSLHGIGFILLDIENPSESQVIIPARERSDLDWESINRLTEANKDFSAYIEEISDFCLTGKTKKTDWDQSVSVRPPQTLQP
jgi:uncharacterized protein